MLLRRLDGLFNYCRIIRNQRAGSHTRARYHDPYIGVSSPRNCRGWRLIGISQRTSESQEDGYIRRLSIMNEMSKLSLEQAFRAYPGLHWYFVKPGGNWGDHLIYAGAERLADRLAIRRTDLDFLTFDPDELTPGSAIYLHGGGGLNPWGSGRAFANLRKALSVRDAVVIQGPQTCDTISQHTAGLLAASCANIRAEQVILFGRERTTLDYLRNHIQGRVKVELDHDTALQLNTADVLELAGLSSMPRGRYDLLVAREDDEAPPMPPGGSKHFVRMDPAYFATSFAHWIRVHAYARSITSNRLHSAIVGCLLGRPVDLVAGSYHKNHSIWEHSLRNRGVNWVECAEPSANVARSHSRRQWIPDRIAQSWKAQRTLMWLRRVPLA